MHTHIHYIRASFGAAAPLPAPSLRSLRLLSLWLVIGIIISILISISSISSIIIIIIVIIRRLTDHVRGLGAAAAAEVGRK